MNECVSATQVIALMVLSRLSLTLMYFGANPLVRQDIWWENAFDVLLTILAAWGLSFLWRRFPGQSLMQVMQTVLGRYAGKAVAFLYVLFLLHSLSLTLRATSEIFITVSLPRTPAVVVIALLAMTGAFGVRAGIEVVGRTAEAIFPVLVGSVILLFVLMFPRLRLDQLLPLEVLTTGPVPHLQSMVGVVGRTVELIGVSMLVPSFRHPKRLFVTVCEAMAWLAGLWIIMSVMIVTTLGGDIQAYPFPWLMAVRSVEMMEFMERFDALVLAVWVLGIFVRTALLLWASAQALAHCVGLHDYRILALPAAGIATAYAIAQAESVPELLHHLRPEVFTPLTLFFTVLLPMGVLLVAALRGIGRSS